MRQISKKIEKYFGLRYISNCASYYTTIIRMDIFFPKDVIDEIWNKYKNLKIRERKRVFEFYTYLILGEEIDMSGEFICLGCLF